MNEVPRWLLPLRSQPDILHVGSAPVGVLKVEQYRPVTYWQVGLFEGSTTVMLSTGGKSWRLSLSPLDILVIPPHAAREYSTENVFRHF